MKGLALLTGITGIVALVLAAACSGTAKSSATSCAPSGLCGGSGGQVCTTVDARGVCSGIVYETGEGDNFQCDSCQDCTSAQSAASAACGGGSSSGGSGSSSGGTDGGALGACVTGSTLTTLPACSAPATTSLSVPAGCVPTIDGTYHSGEWQDAACISVASDPVYVKYSATTLYLAWPMTPTCGCPAQLAFNADGSMTLDGHQIDLGIFDDPGSATGDASEFTSQASGWTQDGAIASGIVIANPPNMPALVTYELAIPFSQLGITVGQLHTYFVGSSDVWVHNLKDREDQHDDPRASRARAAADAVGRLSAP